jgi:2-haloacid dehalogenase
VSSSAAQFPRAVLFDLLTALLDSWSLWNRAAGSEAAGRAWRAAYLRLTYGCGTYVPYSTLVEQAAQETGVTQSAVQRLHAQWPQLPVWSGAQELLQTLAPHTQLAIVTNCSKALGEQAASLLDVRWSVVITAEEAGFYKPHPRPYALALERLGVAAHEAAFVAGSGYDLFGTQKVGLRTYWHNRVALAKPEGAPDAEVTAPTLDAALPWLHNFQNEKSA